MTAPIAVTGGSGSIGRALLAAASVRQLALHELDAAALRAGDLATVAAELAAVRPRAIIHLAGSTPARVDPTDADPFASNRVLTALVLDAAARLESAPRIVLASSAAVYGETGAEVFAEDAPLRGASAYALSKVAAEQQLRDSSLPGVALRVFNAFGPGQHASLVNRLIASTADSAVELREPEQFVRDYVHVDDIAEALLRAAEVDLDPSVTAINIGSGEAMSSAQLVERLRAAGRAVHVTVAPGPLTRSVADPSRAAHVLGWCAITAIDQGPE